MKHDCPKKGTYEWRERVDKPKVCPRCKLQLDRNKKEVQNVNHPIQ